MQPQKQPNSPQDQPKTREQRRNEFLEALEWTNVTLETMQADASFRRYYRLHGTTKPMLMMEDPPDRPPVPPFVMVEPYMKVAEHLRALGLRTPQIHFKDVNNGLLIIEDFGNDTYTRIFNAGATKPLYELAVDVLVRLHKNPDRCNIDVPKYDEKLLVEEAMLLLDWYYPALSGKKPTDEMRESFANVWKELFKKMPADQETLVLRDFHVDNLMVIAGAKGVQSCGLLDFQDAVIGQFSYDLMSLLEDARREMPKELKDHLYERYVESMGEDLDRESFDTSFRILSAQRHAKVLGIFVRLSVRDGKDRYLQFIPHVHNLFMDSLNNPVLEPLKKWFDENGISMEKPLKNIEKPKGPQP